MKAEGLLGMRRSLKHVPSFIPQILIKLTSSIASPPFSRASVSANWPRLCTNSCSGAGEYQEGLCKNDSSNGVQRRFPENDV